jgi:hypothetical protein
VELEGLRFTGAELAHFIADSHLDRAARPLAVNGELQPFVVERYVQGRALELHPEGDLLNRGGQPWRKAKDSVADLAAGIDALHQIERAGHDPHMDALSGRASLDVLGVAV